MPKIAVIGGGISGLAAALELSHSELQIHVQVFETQARLGGVLETIRDGHYLIERSADNFATLIPDALELTRNFGNEDTLIRPSEQGRQAFVLRSGQLHPIPVGFSLMQPTQISSILTTKTLSLLGKLRLMAEFFVPAKADDSDESLASFATRRLGRQAYENLVEPIVSGIFTADPATLSMKATMPQFVSMEKKHGSLIRAHLASRKSNAAEAAKRASGARYDQFLAPRGGMSQWIADLQSQLPSGGVQLSCPVHAIEPAGLNWKVVTGQGTTVVDGVIVATPAGTTSKLLSAANPKAAELASQIQYASSAVVALVVAKSELSGRVDGFGAIMPRKEGRRCLAISYSSNKYPNRVPEDEILFRLFFGGALEPAMVDKPDAELIELAKTELREVLGWWGSETRWQGVIRWPMAMPQYTLEHLERVHQLEEHLQETPGLELCGAAYRGVGIPQCVRSGREAAYRLLAMLVENPS